MLPLHENTGGLFLAETDGTKPRELVAVNAEGAVVYAAGAEGFDRRSTVPFPSLWPSRTRQPAFLLNVSNDLDGDGRGEWLVPTAAGYEVRNAEGLIAEIPCDVVSTISRWGGNSISHRLPGAKIFELPGQDLVGLAFVSDERADFAFGPGWQDRKSHKIPIKVEDKWEGGAHLADVNGDGWLDILVSQVRGTVNMEMMTQVYIANGLCSYPEEPAATFASKGAISSPILKDVNGDGKTDLFFIKVPFGVSTFINYFLWKSISVQIEVFLGREAGFPTEPDYEDSLSLDAPEGREEIAHTFGDFNGDGYLDASFSSGAGKLAVHTGAEGQALSRKPWAEVLISSFGRARAIDLDHDGADELVLFHPGMDNSSKIEVIRFEPRS